MIFLYILLINLIISGLVRAQLNDPLLSIPFTLTDNINSIVLELGIDPTATNGIDTHLGEQELPPLPPLGIFEVRFVGTNIGIDLGNGTLKDYRFGEFPINDSRIHEIFIQRGSSDTVNFLWNLPEGVTGNLQDFFGGILVNADLADSGMLALTNPALTNLKLTINYDLNPTIIGEINSLDSYELYQNYPNPFNTTTKIKFGIPENTRVKIEVFNILGERVEEIVNKDLEVGYHEIRFNANGFASGVYFYRIETSKFNDVKKMVILK